MKAIQLAGPGRLEVVEQEKPRPGPGEVLVRIKAVGLCGTDLHLFQGIFGEFPIIPGHDAAGVIEETGPGVDQKRTGARVTIDPAGCCLRSADPGPLCPNCRVGRTNLCEGATYMGMTSPGALAQYLTVPAARAVDLPESITDQGATVLEPVVVGLHLLEQTADRPGRAMIIGGGPIGLVAALMLQSQGRRVTLLEPIASRRGLAQELGLEEAVGPADLTGLHPAGLIVETSGHPSASETVVAAAQPGATVVLVGGPTDIPGLVILTRELEVRAVKGGRGLYPQAVEWVTAQGLDLGGLISHVFPVAQAETAFKKTIGSPERIFRSVLETDRW